MSEIATNALASETHKSALRAKADTVSRILIPRYFNTNHPPAPIAADSFAGEICNITRNYVPVLQRSADQIAQLHDRRVQEDLDASRQISRE